MVYPFYDILYIPLAPVAEATSGKGTLSKKPSTLPLNLRQATAGVPLYRWWYEELRSAILSGNMLPGARLPATRDLAAQYGLSRPTIVTAFELLRSEGYVEGKVGSGTYVSKTLPDELLHVPRSVSRPQLHRRRVRLSTYARNLTPLRRRDSPRIRAFRANLPALDEFPTALWAQIASRRLRHVSASLLAGGEALGYRPLREAVAEYLNTSRGVKCAAEQVLIISGVQEALNRAAHLLLDPGDPVWMEEPGYPGATLAFQSVGARICPVPVDAEGLNLEAGIERCPRPRMIYVTPGHQFPLGVTMSLSRRLSLLEWARRGRAIIFEDDYDSEYRYSGRPIPAMQGLDKSSAVIFAGSFSLVLFPSLRLGYVVVPPDMVDIFAAAASVSTHHPPLIDQAILCDFIREGHFARHVRRMRQLYAERLGVLMEAARARLGSMLEIGNVEAGLRTVGWLAPGISAERIAQEAAEHNVDVVPLSRYGTGRSPRNGLVLGFAAVGPRELRRGVEKLALLLEEGD
ncbi:MAG TPA: PLP-dependent aminotransferase family protein [Terriglobales bacterium]